MGGARRLVAVALVGVVAWGLGACSASSVAPASARPTADVAALLQRQAHALAAGDLTAWKAGIADQTKAEGARQLEAFDNLRALGVTRASFTALHERDDSAAQPASPSAEQEWHGTAQLAYRIPGADRADRVTTRTIRAVQRDGVWRVSSWLADTDTPEAFDLPSLIVRRTAHTVVAVSSGVMDLGDCSEAAEQAWSRVTAVTGSANGIPGVAVIVPPTPEATAAMIGRSTARGLDVVGATTVGARAVGQPAAADRVVLGPDAARRLTAEGRIVVLTHEFTHVALRATTRSELPMWLSEGLAEYVAYRESNLDPRTIATAAIQRATGSRWPTRLPTADEFDTTAAGFDTAYQSSWLAVRTLATHIGDAGLVTLVHEVAGSLDTPTAPDSAVVLSAVLRERGTSESDLAAAVRSQLIRWGADQGLGAGLQAAASR